MPKLVIHRRLTTAANGEMIRAMLQKLIAGLLIFGWVTLSGFDLLEDFKPFSGPVLGADRAADDGRAPRDGWGALANNIVESANRAPEVIAAPHTSSVVIGNVGTAVDFRGFFLRHKLYRVYLI